MYLSLDKYVKLFYYNPFLVDTSCYFVFKDMAQINDVDSGESFITMLEEIRTKLIFQVVGEMVETETELHHAHRQFGKAGLGM